jgi:hypothetical protein
MITPDLTAYAGRLAVELPERGTREEIAQMMGGVISKVTVRCFEEGAKLIGHVKGMVESEDGGFLAISSTTEDGRVQTKGDLEGGRKLQMVINVIIYGLNVHKVEHIVTEVATDLLGPSFKLESDEHEHHHDEEPCNVITLK